MVHLAAFLQWEARGVAGLRGALCEVSCCCCVGVGFEKQPVALQRCWKEMMSAADGTEENDFCISFLRCWALPETAAVLQPVKCV